MIRLYEIPALILIIIITAIHARRFNANKAVGPWWHLWYACLYGIPCVVAVWICHWSLWLAGALILERFVLYNQILNVQRKPRRAFFYIVAKNSKPGFWDKIYTWLNKFYPYVWGIGAAAFIAINCLFNLW